MKNQLSTQLLRRSKKVNLFAIMSPKDLLDFAGEVPTLQESIGGLVTTLGASNAIGVSNVIMSLAGAKIPQCIILDTDALGDECSSVVGQIERDQRLSGVPVIMLCSPTSTPPDTTCLNVFPDCTLKGNEGLNNVFKSIKSILIQQARTA